jgi:hypothetical protein
MSAAASPSAILRVRRVAAVVFALGVATTLSACVDEAHTPELTPSASPSETAGPQPSDTPTATLEPLDISCDELVDPDAVYAFNPNLALIGDWTPDAGTPAADALDAGGVACRWVFESGGGTMDISAARLPEERITELKNEAFASSQMVPTYGDEAYFEVEGGVGTAIVFQDRFWMVVSSLAFAEPGEPTEIIDSALAALAALPPSP